MTVPVSEISRKRLEAWLADCERDHATPIALVAVGHDHVSGQLHLYRTEDGPSDQELGALVSEAGLALMGVDLNAELRRGRRFA